MTNEEIMAKLGEVIEASAAEDIDWSTVTESTELESFGFDSLAVLDLIFDIEQEVGVQVAAEDMMQMETLGELVSYISKRV
jgi:acyl carrier protein